MKSNYHFPTLKFSNFQWALRACCFVLFAAYLSSCSVYSFKDVSIQPPNAKTIHIGYIENKARYVNPLLSPQLTDKFKTKISTTVSKLTSVESADADFDVAAYISG